MWPLVTLNLYKDVHPLFNQEVAKKLASYMVCLCLLLCKCSYCMVWLLISMDIIFSWILLGFLSMIIMKFYIHSVFRYKFFSGWLLDIRISTCSALKSFMWLIVKIRFPCFNRPHSLVHRFLVG